MAMVDPKSDSARGVFIQKQRANVYSMMLILALLFIMVGNLCLYLEMKSFGMKVKVPTAAQASAVQKPLASPVGNLPGM